MSDTPASGIPPVPYRAPALANEALAKIEAELHRLCDKAGGRLRRRPPKLAIVPGAAPMGWYEFPTNRVLLSAGALDAPDDDLWRVILAHEVGHVPERWWRLAYLHGGLAVRRLAQATFLATIILGAAFTCPDWAPNVFVRLAAWHVFGSDWPFLFVVACMCGLALLADEALSKRSKREPKHELRADRFIIDAGHPPERVAVHLWRICAAHGVLEPDAEMTARMRALGEPGERVLAEWRASAARLDGATDAGGAAGRLARWFRRLGRGGV